MSKRTLKPNASIVDELYLQRLLAALPMPAAVLAANRQIWMCNEPWTALTGEAAGGALESQALDRCKDAPVRPCEGARAAYESVIKALEGAREGCTLDYPCLDKGEEQWSKITVAPIGEPHDGVLILLEEVTRVHRQDEALAQLAYRDPLTGLPNDRLFLEHAEQILTMAKRNAHGAAVVKLDVNDFRAINKRYGQDVGDRLLIEVADRLRGALRETDVLARAGSDDFAALLTAVEPEEVLNVLKRCHSSLADPYQLAERNMHISTSMGVSLYPRHAGDIKLLLRCADSALRQAKTRHSAIEVFRHEADG